MIIFVCSTTKIVLYIKNYKVAHLYSMYFYSVDIKYILVLYFNKFANYKK